MKTLIRNGTLVTMNKNKDVFVGDIYVENGRIKKIAKKIEGLTGLVEVLDATDQIVVPGLIQAHTHLVQTLFRGEADDLSLLDWLKKRIWPLEAAHNADSIKASVNLGVLEMIKCGTTTIFDMGTVNHTDELLEAAHRTKIRYFGGKCLMDAKARSGPLYEHTNKALIETQELIGKWHKKTSTMNYVLCPRFVLSCTPEILEAVVDLQKKKDCLVHIHASESKEEIAQVKKLYKKNNVEYLNYLGLLNSKTVVIHGVHITDKELALMVKNKTGLVHCPSSNLKLASGIAPIEKYKRKKLRIGLGSDGTPCNNSMDPFKEMHLAALLQKPLFGPTAMPAHAALELATMGGARVLGMEKDLGSLEVGKYADIVTVARNHPSVATVEDPYSALVYSCTGRDVRHVFINGEWVIRDTVPRFLEEELVIYSAKREKHSLFRRANLRR